MEENEYQCRRAGCVLDRGRLPQLFGSPTFVLKRISRDFFLKTKLSPFLPSEMIEDGLCLLGQSNTHKSIWRDGEKRILDGVVDAQAAKGNAARLAIVHPCLAPE